MTEKNEMRGPEPKAKELSATATAELEFRDGVLHQRFVVHREDGSAEPEWRPVPEAVATTTVAE